MADTTGNTGVSGIPMRLLSGLGAGSGNQEVVTLADSAGNLLGTTGAPLVVMLVPASTGNLTAPALAVTSFTALAGNTARKAATFYNDSVNTVYLALSAAASTTSYTVQIPPNGYYELPGDITVYTGIVTATSAVASGNLRVTELT